MKFEIDAEDKVINWLNNPHSEPAVFQGQDLRKHSAKIAAKNLSDCSFLGCKMEPILAQAAVEAKCLVIPLPPEIDISFKPFKPSLYTPEELFDKFDLSDPENSYHKCLDWRIYNSFINPENKKPRPVDVDVILMRRFHDASISDALDDLLDPDTSIRTVAIMGGHDIGRDTKIYADTARLAQMLCQEKYLIITGGGPGLMEAANLGAYTMGFADPKTALDQALIILSSNKDGLKYDGKHWLPVGYKTWKEMGKPDNSLKSRNVGIPTWLYGHEPPNVFATLIAKYFENSIREEGLTAVALGGVVFAEGNAGTVQEMFQDACQNYYRTYHPKPSPMVLFGSEYWDPSGKLRHIREDKRKPAYSLLEKLATEKSFADYLLVTDDVEKIVKFIQECAKRQN